jgi:Predicted transcriptional regulators
LKIVSLALEKNITYFCAVILIIIMDRFTIQDALFPTCPIRNILSRICDKWSLLVLATMTNGCQLGSPSEPSSSPSSDVVSDIAVKPMRFNELQKAIPDISQKMLTVTLRTLEEDGYVTRKIYPEVPPRVEYTLTARAKSLLPHISDLIGWAIENFDAVVADRKSS